MNLAEALSSKFQKQEINLMYAQKGMKVFCAILGNRFFKTLHKIIDSAAGKTLHGLIQSILIPASTVVKSSKIKLIS